MMGYVFEGGEEDGEKRGLIGKVCWCGFVECD